ncbi:MAG: hypothetical protein M1840_006017 [Geoglossum simile]|nr:MAG: hypothetical protein M1840_006017 [Geoglossum simile]
MAPQQRLAVAVPTTAALHHSIKLRPGDGHVLKALNRLPRPALLAVILDWLDEKSQPLCRPYLAEDVGEDEGDDGEVGFAPAASVEEVIEEYQSLQQRKGGRREVVDRVVHGDWRRGLNLYQMATIDLGYLLVRPASQRWSALKLCRVVSGADPDDAENVEELRTTELPRFHAPTFLRNLQREISPVAKAHYYLTRVEGLPLTVLRIRLQEIPYNSNPVLLGISRLQLAADDGSTLFIGFPDSTPMVYVTITSRQFREERSLRKIVLDVRPFTLLFSGAVVITHTHHTGGTQQAIPKAISRPYSRYTLSHTSMSARTLQALLFLRGPGRGGAAGGGWGIFIEGSVEGNPLGFPSFKSANDEWGMEPHEVEGNSDGRTNKRRKLIAQGRFGESGIGMDGKGIELFDIRVEDPFSGVPGTTSSLPINLDEDEPDINPERREEQNRGKQWSSLFDSDHDSEPHPDLQTWRPNVRLTFQGTHVFAGVRKLVDSGVVDGVRMPGWMTGEVGVSGGLVRDGIVKVKEGKLWGS